MTARSKGGGGEDTKHKRVDQWISVCTVTAAKYGNRWLRSYRAAVCVGFDTMRPTNIPPVCPVPGSQLIHSMASPTAASLCCRARFLVCHAQVLPIKLVYT